MIPNVCANCAWCVLLADDAAQPVPALCKEGPEWVHIVDCRVHECGRFRMTGQPRFTVPDAGPQAPEPEGGGE